MRNMPATTWITARTGPKKCPREHAEGAVGVEKLFGLGDDVDGVVKGQIFHGRVLQVAADPERNRIAQWSAEPRGENGGPARTFNSCRRRGVRRCRPDVRCRGRSSERKQKLSPNATINATGAAQLLVLAHEGHSSRRPLPQAAIELVFLHERPRHRQARTSGWKRMASATEAPWCGLGLACPTAIDLALQLTSNFALRQHHSFARPAPE